MAEAALQAPLGEFLPAQGSLPTPSTTKDASADVLQCFHGLWVDEDIPALAPSLVRQTLCHHLSQVEQQQSSEMAVGHCKDTKTKHHGPLPKRTLDRETNLCLNTCKNNQKNNLKKIGRVNPMSSLLHPKGLRSKCLSKDFKYQGIKHT